MRLERIGVGRLPGIDEPFAIEGLSPLLNLIIGPNGIGKTSLCRAVRATLWPEEERLHRGEVRTWWREAGGQSLAELAGGRCRWQREGEAADPPPFPSGHLRFCYTLGLPELFEAGESEVRLEEEIRRQLAGGYDLAGLRAGFEPARRHGRKEEKELREARMARAKLEAEARELADDEDRLADLEGRLRRARDAQEACAPLGLALELAGKREELRAVRARLDDYPEALARVGGDERERLRELREADEKLGAAIGGLERLIEEAEARERDGRLPRGPIEERVLEAQGRHAQSVVRIEAEIAAGSQERAGARARFEGAWQDAAAALPEEGARGIEEADPGRVAELVRRAEAAAREGEGRRRSRAARSLLPSGLALLAIGILLAAIDQAAWLGIAGLGIGLLIAFLLRRAWLLPGDGAGPSVRPAAAIERVRETAEGLRSLERRIAAKENERRRVLDGINRFLRDAGVDDASDGDEADSAVRDLARRSRDVREARERRARAEKDLGTRGEEREKLRRRIGRLFEDLGLRDGDEGGLEALLRDRPDYAELDEKRRHLERSIAEVEARLAERPELCALDREEAERRLREAEERASRVGDLADEIGSIRGKLESARERTDLEEAIAREEGARQALRARRREAVLAAAGRLLLEAVEERHASRTTPAVLERARELFVAFTRGRHELRLKSEGPVKSEGSGLFAYDTVREVGLELEELSDGTRAQLLLAARIAFATHAERGVRPPIFLDEALAPSDPARFRAIAVSLCELARTEGRQVFYLGARDDEIARWRAACTEADWSEARVIDLAAERGRGRAIREPAALRVARRGPPSPEGLSAEQYGARIGVPRPDPFGPEGSLHLFHLLREDLPLLHRLLAPEIETLGQWRALARLGAGRGYVSPEQAETIEAWAAAAEAFFDAWRTGRGRPVDRAALEASGVVSDRFLERVAGLAREVGGDARALLDGLRQSRVPRFRTEKMGELESYLRGEGYLDDRPPLDEAAVRARVLAAVADRVEAGVLCPEAIALRVAYLWRLTEPTEGPAADRPLADATEGGTASPPADPLP